MKIALNKWRNVLAVTLTEACVILILTGCLLAVGGCAIIKLCKKLDAQNRVELWIDWTIVPCTCPQTGVVVCALQRSTNLCDWNTLAEMTWTGGAQTLTVKTNYAPEAFFRIIPAQ